MISVYEFFPLSWIGMLTEEQEDGKESGWDNLHVLGCEIKSDLFLTLQLVLFFELFRSVC